MPKNLWNNTDAPQTDGLDSLTYRSRLLGADRTVVNIFGGNTSTKSLEQDHMGREVSVLFVKGSGTDVATITNKGFAALKLDEVLPLFNRNTMSDEDMTSYLDRTAFETGRPRQSIETLLHAFVPAKHVDHTHPDAIISIACTEAGKSIMTEIYGNRAAWVDYIRPGFTLSQQIGAAVRNNPQLECLVMGKHGLVTWGETSKQCYENTIKILNEAEAYLEKKKTNHPFGAPVSKSLDAAQRNQALDQLLPVLRGAMSGNSATVLKVDASPEVLEFVNAADAASLSQIGAACPDHLVHTKRLPLFVQWQPETDNEGKLNTSDLLTKAREGVEKFSQDYTQYFEVNKSNTDVMFTPNPRVVLIPGVGMVTSGPDANGAEISRQLYRRAIEVMRGAQSLAGFISLSAEESYAIEYWPLELYKLSLKPAPKSLAGKVALVTGAASGIGKAIAMKFAEEGAHLVIADLNLEGAKTVATEIVQTRGENRAIALAMNVTSESEVQAAFRAATLHYGGLDIVVNNAGIASSAPIEETTLEMWNKNQNILSTGYFLVARQAFQLFKNQGRVSGEGGNLIFICSKNSLVAGKNAAAYSAAKAAELHLARCLAEEGGASGIRVNSVLPDAVLSGSAIWNGTWREERARSYGIKPEELEEFYRKRTTLRLNVFPSDIAAAAFFFASNASAKTTGGVLTVDGGVAAAYVR